MDISRKGKVQTKRTHIDTVKNNGLVLDKIKHKATAQGI